MQMQMRVTVSKNDQVDSIPSYFKYKIGEGDKE